MDAVLRATAIYLFLLVLFRLAGKRTLSQITTFDFVLLLIVGEATQQALLGEDFSVTNAVVVITTLIGWNVLLSLLKERWTGFGTVVEGRPMVVVSDGRLPARELRWARADVGDVLEQARSRQGLETLEEVRYAIVERDGSISIIPRDPQEA